GPHRRACGGGGGDRRRDRHRRGDADRLVLLSAWRRRLAWWHPSWTLGAWRWTWEWWRLVGYDPHASPPARFQLSARWYYTCTAACRMFYIRIGRWQISVGRHRARCWQ